MRAAWISCLVIIFSSVALHGAEKANAYAEDFDALWEFLRDNYAYFDAKRTNWDRAREVFLLKATEAANEREFVGVLETLLEQLYDPHAHLKVNTPSSPRLMPSALDVWAEFHAGRAVIMAVRQNSAARRSGLRAGMEIHSIDGVAVSAAARTRLPVTLDSADPAADNWALRALLAGRGGNAVRLEARDRGELCEYVFTPDAPSAAKLADWQMRPDGIGYIRINNSLGEIGLVAEFDRALEALKDARALIIDLRDTPSGGNTTVARGIMGRLLSAEKPYQRHELAAEERRHHVRRGWIELVAPRGPFAFTNSVLVLVGRWTGSMGEGVAIGLHGAGRARVMGTPMAGLLGATYEFRLPHAGFTANIPAERLFHVNGTPREKFLPEPVAAVDAEGDQLIEDAARSISSR